MRFSDIKGMQVVGLQNAQKLGVVDDLLLTDNGEQILAVKMQKVGLLAGHRVILWQDVQAIGQNALTVASEDMLHDQSDVPELQNALDLANVIGLKVMDKKGTDIGTVSDMDFNDQTGQVIHYFVQSGGLLHHHLQSVPMGAVESIGKNMMIVNTAAMAG